ncbi:uncharacterized protein LOC102803666 [Saccoglossus kowalevskii]|uniref:Latent-transforming growth factor beta-binding protein 2-like n=1 Tax=Saccoglossus kowalevskii TaxID=10224 RepID=A0ABM0MRF1_SACKO|nr:PREDICTED: latent-transforming growth factor beta-binding protein 2-like [Saccoglossus kowalevskii]
MFDMTCHGILVFFIFLFAAIQRGTSVSNALGDPKLSLHIPNSSSLGDPLSEPQILPSTLTEQDALVIEEKMNFGRRKVSPAPSNMNFVFWNTELSDAAQESVNTCLYANSQPSWISERSLVVTPYYGYHSTELRTPEIIEGLFNLGRFYDYTTMYCSVHSFYCKLYRMVTWYSMFSVGCAQQYCSKLQDTFKETVVENVVYWKCNFENVGEYRNNAIRPYSVSSDGVCSQCISGSAWCNDGLCDGFCHEYSDGDPECVCKTDCHNRGTVDPVYCSCSCDYGYVGDYCDAEGHDEDGSWFDGEWFPSQRGAVNGTDLCEIESCPSNLVFDLFNCKCDCERGYFLAYGTCYDIDECATLDGVCEYGCKNFDGTYTCTCAVGFALDSNQRTCIELNECETGISGCSHKCFNTYRSYYCECDIGYQLARNRRECTRVAPEITSRSKASPCDGIANGGCEQVCSFNDNVTCACRDGFELAGDKTTCLDLDECADNSAGCEYDCVNLNGSYSCQCPNGQILSYDGHTCEADVCSMGSHCNGNGVLDKTTCQCHCSSGYDGTTCDVPCVSNMSNCWTTYKEPTPMYDVDYCPVFCKQCGCFDFPVCRNGGMLNKVAGYEFDIDIGMCMCYCQYPWRGRTCTECSIDCLNGGTLDKNRCLCECPVGWHGMACEKQCEEKSMLCTSRSQPYCETVALVAEKCPILCGICGLA